MKELAEIQTQLVTELPDLKTILPKHISIDEFIRCAAIAMMNNEKLMECDRKSLLMSLSECAQDGLVPDSKEAALIPFNCNVGTKDKPNWVSKAQYMPMIDGVLKRARMSGEIKTIASKAVYESDEFDYWLDEDGEHIKFRPAHSDRGEFKLCFAFCRMNNDELLVEVMTKVEVDKVRAASKTGTYGPWKDWYDRMSCKSVTHRLAKRLPNSSEIIRMMETALQVEFSNKEPEKEIIDVTPKAYPQEKLDSNLDAWSKAISSGKTSPQHIISMIISKHTLTEVQETQIKNLTPAIEEGKK